MADVEQEAEQVPLTEEEQLKQQIDVDTNEVRISIVNINYASMYDDGLQPGFAKSTH